MPRIEDWIHSRYSRWLFRFPGRYFFFPFSSMKSKFPTIRSQNIINGGGRPVDDWRPTWISISISISSGGRGKCAYVFANISGNNAAVHTRDSSFSSRGGSGFFEMLFEMLGSRVARNRSERGMDQTATCTVAMPTFNYEYLHQAACLGSRRRCVGITAWHRLFSRLRIASSVTEETGRAINIPSWHGSPSTLMCAFVCPELENPSFKMIYWPLDFFRAWQHAFWERKHEFWGMFDEAASQRIISDRGSPSRRRCAYLFDNYASTVAPKSIVDSSMHALRGRPTNEKEKTNLEGVETRW